MSRKLIDRRQFTFGSLALSGMILAAPGTALAETTAKKRLLFVLQRGAADGLSTLAPIADPAFVSLRKPLLDDYEGAARLDGLFTLHPAYSQVGAMVERNEALFVHAVSTSYRERSHFDAQNMIESGGAQPYATRDGWLNRLIGLLAPQNPRALALAQSVPLALQGRQAATSYAPSALPGADDDLLARVATMYEADAQLSSLFNEAVMTRALAGDTGVRNLRNAEKAGELAASLMRGPEGARIMMIESDGWDTHANQSGQFRFGATRLDSMLGAFRTGMGGEWAETLVIVATEFGRTVALNGSGGSDHGTGSAMMLLGGKVRGGRVLADWPGLKPNDLFEGRDLRPTQSAEAVMAGAVAEHFGLDPARAMAALFPGRAAQALGGLVKA